MSVYLDAFDDIEDLFDFVEDNFAARVNLDPPGDCTWARHNELQRPVHPLCDGPPPRRGNWRTCDGRIGCGALRKRGVRSVQCAVARGRINRECYRGGNRTHRREELGAIRSANECRRLFRGRRCGGRQFFD